ncbi:hypothetical protein BD413DRAFT_71368 [Trametes elegans]|nr:hypothetical protein BD413DRAFT_71368 [Trametes elegans]
MPHSTFRDQLSARDSIPSLDRTYGAILLGTFLSLILYGVELYQAYRYTRLHTADSHLAKGYVITLLIVDAFNTATTMHVDYWYLVKNYFNPYRYTGEWSINLQPVFAACIAVMCQSFFACRVYRVDRRLKPLVAVVAVMLLAELALATVVTIKAVVLPNLQIFAAVTQRWTSSVFAVALVVDALLTAVLIVVLHRSRTKFMRTNSIIDTLMIYAMCTGSMTMLCGLSCLVAILAMPEALIFAGIEIVSTRIYVISVLVALNFRDSSSTGDDGATRDSGAIDLPNLARSRIASLEPSYGWEPTQVIQIGKPAVVGVKVSDVADDAPWRAAST